MPIILPYALDGLMPHMSAQTLCVIVERILPRYLCKQADCSHHAIQLSHHLFWLNHLSDTPKAPSKTLTKLICQDFGSIEKLQQEFLKYAHCLQTRFVWLVLDLDKGKLRVVGTSTDTLLSNYKPLLVCNLWQHAYYLDYHDRADDYLLACLSHLTDWYKVEFDYFEPMPVTGV